MFPFPRRSNRKNSPIVQCEEEGLCNDSTGRWIASHRRHVGVAKAASEDLIKMRGDVLTGLEQSVAEMVRMDNTAGKSSVRKRKRGSKSPRESAKGKRFDKRKASKRCDRPTQETNGVNEREEINRLTGLGSDQYFNEKNEDSKLITEIYRLLSITPFDKKARP